MRMAASTNHIHIIIQSEFNKLSELVRDFKIWFAENIIKETLEGAGSRREWMIERFEKATLTNKRNFKRRF